MQAGKLVHLLGAYHATVDALVSMLYMYRGMHSKLKVMPLPQPHDVVIQPLSLSSIVRLPHHHYKDYCAFPCMSNSSHVSPSCTAPCNQALSSHLFLHSGTAVMLKWHLLHASYMQNRHNLAPS